MERIEIRDTTVYIGDCLKTLSVLPEKSVNCCVTSPPYWGLRDYGTAKWTGGVDECQHTVGGQVQDNKAVGAIVGGVRPGCDASVCKKCGARRIDSQLGLEKTPQEYVEKMVDVFRGVWRVLCDDGTLWLNLGDCFNAAGRSGQGTRIGFKQGTNRASAEGVDQNRPTDPMLKPKDLVGIPWRVAFALQDDGWYLRRDIIWHKPNPMPESVRDRCTSSHEYIFMLAKQERYYYDADAIREHHRMKPQRRPSGRPMDSTPRIGQPKQGWSTATRDYVGIDGNTVGRNKRSVWTVPTHPYSGAHFATFPPKLIEPCILAGCPKGGTVIDPFGGSGTTAMVANAYGRKAVICELNAKYLPMIRDRLTGYRDCAVDTDNDDIGAQLTLFNDDKAVVAR